MDEAPTISTHVLDTEHGRPAANVAVDLSRMTDDGPDYVGSGLTDADGRIRRLTEGPLEPGDYMLSFRIEGKFFHEVTVSFRVDDPTRSFHVPLLLSSYSLTTYRGS